MIDRSPTFVDGLSVGILSPVNEFRMSQEDLKLS